MGVGAVRRFIAGFRPERTSRSGGPSCRIMLDLQRLPWGADPEAAQALVGGRPGVLDVRVDARCRRAVVWHDGRTSFPELFNWLQAQAGPTDAGRR